jgi:hypothetical protein
MDTNLASQLKYLVQNNSGAKIEKIIEQILESDLININDFLQYENIKSVSQFNLAQHSSTGW